MLQANNAPRVRLNTHLNVRDRRVNLTYRRDIKGNSECRDRAVLRHHRTLSSDTSEFRHLRASDACLLAPAAASSLEGSLVVDDNNTAGVVYDLR